MTKPKEKVVVMAPEPIMAEVKKPYVAPAVKKVEIKTEAKPVKVDVPVIGTGSLIKRSGRTMGDLFINLILIRYE